MSSDITITSVSPVDPDMIKVDDAAEAMKSRGFENIDIYRYNSYKDNSTIIICPTRGAIHHRVVSAWQSLISPMNQKRLFLFAVGAEVGQAYSQTIAAILANPDLSKWKYILTLEDDNLPPPDAHIRLLETIEQGNWDAVGGLYWTKGEIQMPMCYGNPDDFYRTGELDFRPRDVREAVKEGHVVPCCGVAMGCTLYKMDLFKDINGPWFTTVADFVHGIPMSYTQDLHFAERATRFGKKFAVDCGIKVGHLDTSSGIVY